MGIEVKERKAPGKLNSNAAALIAEVEKAGFSKLGWLSVKVFTPMSVAGFVDSSGTVVLAIAGILDEGSFQAMSIDLVTGLASGETITTTSTTSIYPQPERGIFKYVGVNNPEKHQSEAVRIIRSTKDLAQLFEHDYAGPKNEDVRKLVDAHAKNLKKHKSKAVPRGRSIKDLAQFIEGYLKHEMEGLLVRHWLTSKPGADNVSGSKASGVEGGYVSVGSNTIRIGLEKGNFMWGGWDIHDSGTYEVLGQSEEACVISLNSRLGGDARRIEITRIGKKYLFTKLPGRTDPEIFLRLDGAQFLSDSKALPKTEKPELGEGAASGKYLPVEQTVEEFEKGFLQNVRKEVIPLLIRDGMITGKTIKKKVHVLDDGAFRLVMKFGIENFVLNQQGWSFAAFQAPFDNVAKTLQARKDVSNYTKNVGAIKLKQEVCAPTGTDSRHVFLVRFTGSEWSILFQTIHWVEIADLVLGDQLAKDISKRLKCTAIAAGDTDAGGSGATIYKSGKKAGEYYTEENWERFYALFYTEGIFLPASFIAEVQEQPRFMVSDPTIVDRVDYMQIALPETDED